MAGGGCCCVTPDGQPEGPVPPAWEPGSAHHCRLLAFQPLLPTVMNRTCPSCRHRAAVVCEGRGDWAWKSDPGGRRCRSA